MTIAILSTLVAVLFVLATAQHIYIESQPRKNDDE